jgi:fatty acid desaturase
MDEANDPDCYPSLATYRRSLGARIADRVSFGHRRPLGFLTLGLGFTGQSAQMLWNWSRHTTAMSKRERRLAIFETVAGWAVWIAVLALVGPARFAFAFVLPLLVGNAIVISYILTNHNLSPMTGHVNDPLVNSLSVTLPRVFEKMHLNFGLHVEHHLFPSMSSYYAPLVRDELVRRWPERYQSLPMFTALARLARTPRVYGSDVVLHDPIHGFEASTILPRTDGTTAVAAASSATVDDAPSVETAEPVAV